MTVARARTGTRRGTSSAVIHSAPFVVAVRFPAEVHAREGAGARASATAPATSTDLAIGAGVADSCAACHGRPRGSAGSVGTWSRVPTAATRRTFRPRAEGDARGRDHRRPPRDPRGRRGAGVAHRRSVDAAGQQGHPLRHHHAPGPMEASTPRGVKGVDPTCGCRPFFAHGGTISIREFVVGALKAEMGLGRPSIPNPSRPRRALVPRRGHGPRRPGASKPPPANTADPDGTVERVRRPSSTTWSSTCSTTSSRAPTSRPARARWAPDIRDHRVRLVPRAGPAHRSRPPRGRPRDHLQSSRREFQPAVCDRHPLLHANRDPAASGPQRRSQREAVPGARTSSRTSSGTTSARISTSGTTTARSRRVPDDAAVGRGHTAPYGHDGSSINLTEVILRHGGEAQAARTPSPP